MWRMVCLMVSVAAVAGGATALHVHVPPTGADEAPAEARRYHFALNEPIAVQASSKPVRWRGHDYLLADFGEVTFAKDGEHLTAKLRGRTQTVEDVDYHVSLAIFDADDRLLGVAAATCEVQRLWLSGRVLMQWPTLEFDFGKSESYQRASTFAIAIAERTVVMADAD